MNSLDENKIKKGLNWFLGKIKKSADKKSKPDKGDIASKKDFSKKIRPFNLYATLYSRPKFEKTLPYFDAFPLFFPIKFTRGSEGTLLHGVNIHYLPPAMRKKFLRELEIIIRRVADKQGFDPDNLEDYPHQNITRVVGKYMNRVYQSGGGSAGAMIRASYRSYFLSRMGGKLKKIPLNEWDEAASVYLPVFRKQSASAVYADTKEKFDKYKSNMRHDIY